MPLSSYYSLVAQVFECRRDRCDKAVVLEVARPGGLLWVAAKDVRQKLLVAFWESQPEELAMWASNENLEKRN